jgi:hypothetical protein
VEFAVGQTIPNKALIELTGRRTFRMSTLQVCQYLKTQFLTDRENITYPLLRPVGSRYLWTIAQQSSRI